MNDPAHSVPAPDSVTTALREYAGHLANTYTPPPAAHIWLVAARHKRTLACKRALRPLHAMEILSLLCALAALVWTLQRSGLPHRGILSTSLGIPVAHWSTLAAGAIALAWLTLFRASRRLFMT